MAAYERRTYSRPPGASGGEPFPKKTKAPPFHPSRAHPHSRSNSVFRARLTRLATMAIMMLLVAALAAPGVSNTTCHLRPGAPASYGTFCNATKTEPACVALNQTCASFYHDFVANSVPLTPTISEGGPRPRDKYASRPWPRCCVLTRVYIAAASGEGAGRRSRRACAT